MSRDDGFAVMDVSTDIVNDPKVRKLWRHAPDHASAAFTAYVATIAESWKAGRRVSIDDAWPAFLPFDQAAVEALAHVRLLDRTGRVTTKAWAGWFESAHARRAASRERYRRANEKRHVDATDEPRGSNADTHATVPPVSPSSPTEPSSRPSRAARDEPLQKQERENGKRGTPTLAVDVLAEMAKGLGR